MKREALLWVVLMLAGAVIAALFVWVLLLIGQTETQAPTIDPEEEEIVVDVPTGDSAGQDEDVAEEEVEEEVIEEETEEEVEEVEDIPEFEEDGAVSYVSSNGFVGFIGSDRVVYDGSGYNYSVRNNEGGLFLSVDAEPLQTNELHSREDRYEIMKEELLLSFGTWTTCGTTFVDGFTAECFNAPVQGRSHRILTLMVERFFVSIRFDLDAGGEDIIIDFYPAQEFINAATTIN